jgi:hypothetical protein
VNCELFSAVQKRGWLVPGSLTPKGSNRKGSVVPLSQWCRLCFLRKVALSVVLDPAMRPFGRGHKSAVEINFGEMQRRFRRERRPGAGSCRLNFGRVDRLGQSLHTNRAGAARERRGKKAQPVHADQRGVGP